MDAAEAWLRENDPDYKVRSKAWDTDTPGQEILWGDGSDLELLTNAGYEYVTPANRRACERCGDVFTPRTSWHRFCSEACKKQAKRRR
jgi:hypothetical protein